MKFSNGKKINNIEITNEEKTNIDKQILEGEKRINIGKLYVIANELIMEREKNSKEQDLEQKSEFSGEKNKISSLKYKNSLISSSFDKQFINKSMSKDNNSNGAVAYQNKKYKSNISDNQIYLNNRLKDNKNNTFDLNNISNDIKNKNKDKKFINLAKNSSSPNLINQNINFNIKEFDKNKSEVKTGENSYRINHDSPEILNLNESIKRLKV